MSRVWIVQCLCPQRHCILAASAEAGEEDDPARAIRELVRETVASAIAERAINPWCGICKAPASTWHYETGGTPFNSMNDALPELRRLEAEQAIACRVLGDR